MRLSVSASTSKATPGFIHDLPPSPLPGNHPTDETSDLDARPSPIRERAQHPLQRFVSQESPRRSARSRGEVRRPDGRVRERRELAKRAPRTPALQGQETSPGLGQERWVGAAPAKLALGHEPPHRPARNPIFADERARELALQVPFPAHLERSEPERRNAPIGLPVDQDGAQVDVYVRVSPGTVLAPVLVEHEGPLREAERPSEGALDRVAHGPLAPQPGETPQLPRRGIVDRHDETEVPGVLEVRAVVPEQLGDRAFVAAQRTVSIAHPE